MTPDPTTYQYFLQEAPELLQALEQGLLHFKDDRSINQVHQLLRATHTLKGAANSVGLTTIATVAHSLEDIFKTLCKPDVPIDAEVEALLFEGFECLRLPLAAELTGGSVNHAEILDRTATVFAQLQERLGDCFDHNAPFPSSEELGFDVTQSIFEVGVAQRLEQMDAALESAALEDLALMLQTQAEVFLGIGESLKLPGFAAIARSTIAALHHHPEQVKTIAEQALADFRAGQVAVLAGDRAQGGQPSEALQRLVDLSGGSTALLSPGQIGEAAVETANFQTADNQHLLESIWGESAIDVSDVSDVSDDASQDVVSAIAPDPAVPDSAQESLILRPLSSQSTTLPKAVAPAAPASTVRINVKHLDHLNYSLGELLTNQNQQALQTEQLQSAVRTLLLRLKHHQQLLQQLHASSSDARFQPLLDDMVQLTEATDAIDLYSRQSGQTLEKQRHLLTHTRNALIEARMLPLGEIFDRFPHVLQQLETLHNKRATLRLSGTEVLVDKVVAEKLYDPLLHLVRNAFDHGIEPIALRQQREKPEPGCIELCAYNQGKYLVVEVRDDGQGLDFDYIRQRAVEQHPISLEQAVQMTQTELIDLLFAPGFSTTAQVSDLSGRGIGLDVVRNQVNALQGSISVQTEPQSGTTFTLQIPLNLTIARLLVCEAGSKAYAFLDDAIEQILIPQPHEIQERNTCKVLRWQEEHQEQLVLLHPLSTALNYGSGIALNLQPPAAVPQEATKPVILLRHQHDLLGLQVDRLLGEQELVIRPLGTMVATPSYVHGASILANGQLALVIEGTTLLQTVLQAAPSESRADQYQKSIAQLSPSASDSREQPAMLSPARTALLPASVPASVSASVSASGSRLHSRILVVEDSITTRQALALALEKVGYQVVQASNGQEAIAQLQHQPDIQLVICDIEMPVMNGFEVLRRSQQIPELANIPILMLSSRSEEKHRSLASQLGASAYMTKPYIEHKLLTLVADLLN